MYQKCIPKETRIKKVILIGLRTKTRKKFSNFADIKKYYSTL
mgnify:CR=1 FL=1